MTSKVKASAPYRLIVEGPDDLHSIIALTGRHGWDWEHPTKDFPLLVSAGGVEDALDAFELSVRTHDRVGIVLDADLEPMNRWASVRGRLAKAQIPVPNSPEPTGTIVADGAKRVGVWLMPDNRIPGKLEDFLGLLIPADDPCWSFAEEVTTHARDVHGAQISDSTKARIHTWLAWKPKPGQPFGTAITAATFEHDAAAAKAFVEWMTKLYRYP